MSDVYAGVAPVFVRLHDRPASFDRKTPEPRVDRYMIFGSTGENANWATPSPLRPRCISTQCLPPSVERSGRPSEIVNTVWSVANDGETATSEIWSCGV